jgi:large subunit ribosomal protein L9
MISVILLKNINNYNVIGKTKNVTLGYAYNYLFPKNIAKVFAQNKQSVNNNKYNTRNKYKSQNILLNIYCKTTNTGKLFGSINKVKLIYALLKKGIKINTNMWEFSENIKEIGTYRIIIDIPRKIKYILLVNIKNKN